MKPVIIIAIAFVLLIPTNVFAEYEINDICEWATFTTPDKVGFTFSKIAEDLGSEYSNLLNDEYQNLLRSNYQDWEIESGLVPYEEARAFEAQAKLKQFDYLVDKVIETYNVNPELKPLLFARFEAWVSSNWDRMIVSAHTVDLLLYPDFYGKNLECEKEYLENNSEIVYYWIDEHYGSNSAPIMFEEINSRVFGEELVNETTSDETTSDETTSITDSENICGTGTILNKNGQCVPEPPLHGDPEPSSKGGGCLIATATYGSELAPQVQQLRELRDNQLLNTKSGTSFMKSFNDFYYSFSPYIADYERENPIFKEMVKIAITPMITSLSILNYVDMDSEQSVLGYGISLIMLNVMMYVGIPILVIMKMRNEL